MIKIILLALVAMTLAACGETSQAANKAYYSDKPAHITCQGYASGLMVDTDTTGRIEYDAGGRYTFVNAKTGELTLSEGECVVVYKR